MKAALAGYHVQRQATNRFFLAAILLSDPVLELVRRELRRLSPGVKVQVDALRAALIEEVLKRDVVDGERAADARKKVNRAMSRLLRARQPKTEGSELSADQREPTESGDKPVDPPVKKAEGEVV